MVSMVFREGGRRLSRLPRFAYIGVISRYAIVIKDHTGTKIRKLIWLGEAVKVSELYQLATLHIVSFGQGIGKLRSLLTISSSA
jgi:hypothetical protein